MLEEQEESSNNGNAKPDEEMIDDEEENAEEMWEELPISRVIRIEHQSKSSPSPSHENHVLLKSIESDFTLDAPATLFIYRGVSENTYCIFTETTRKHSSPWKGINSYYPGRLLLRANSMSQHPFISFFTMLSKDPSIIQSLGIFHTYEILPTKNIRVSVYIQRDRVLDSIVDFNENSKFLRRKETDMMKYIMQGISNQLAVEEGDPEYCHKRRRADIDFQGLFSICNDLRKKSTDVVPPYQLNVDKLNFQLMPYQKETVQWMIHRETNGSIDDSISFMYECERVRTDTTLFYYPMLGVLTRKKLNKQEQVRFSSKNTLKGGILADEMGLGKTVQVLALISSHRKEDKVELENASTQQEGVKIKEHLPNSSIKEQVQIAERAFTELKTAKKGPGLVRYDLESSIDSETIVCVVCERMCSTSVCGWDLDKYKGETFICSNCRTNNLDRQPIRTTLVIVPESLIFQWFTEISKHCSDDFKVMFYYGIKKHGYLQPLKMEEYDVILTTYDTIRSECAFSDVSHQQRQLRSESRSLFLVTSLVHVNFWRVIVDESQVMPQGVNSQLASMLSNIQGNHWWCVTGTPLVKTVGDFVPLFSFLKLKPFGKPSFFAEYLHSQYLDMFCKSDSVDPRFIEKEATRVLLLQLLVKIMSRRTKSDVEKQLNLPGLTEVEKKIYFTAVEERQYKEERERLKNYVERAIKKADNSLFLADLNCRDKVLNELKTLREVVLTGQTSAHTAGNHSFVYSPETVIFRLVHNKKTSIMNNVRNYIGITLGVAGVQTLLLQADKSLQIYQSVLDRFEMLIFETGVQNAKSREVIARLQDNVPQSDSPRPVDFDELDGNEREDEIDELGRSSEEIERIRNVAGIMKGIQQICKKYNDDSKEDSAKPKNNDDLPGPSDPKKRRIEVPNLLEKEFQEELDAAAVLEKNEVSPDDMDVDDEAAERERQKHNLKSTLLALRPIKMDSTQELHLLLNLRKVQASLGTPEVQRVPVSRIENVCKRYTKLEKQSLEALQVHLPALRIMWSEKNFIAEIVKYFESMIELSSIQADPTALYNKKQRVIRPIVKRDFVSNLPYIALYDDATKKAEVEKEDPKHPRKHILKKCMGRCKNSWTFDPYSGHNCLSVPEVIRKTLTHMKHVDLEKRKIELQMIDLVDFLMKVTDPSGIFLFLKSDPKPRDRFSRMREMTLCGHILIKGTTLEKEGVDEFFTKKHKCEVCDVWCKLTSVLFKAGFSSFHGIPRQGSSVSGFASYLMDYYSSTAGIPAQFKQNYLFPFFECVHDVLKALQSSCLIVIELLHRIHELNQAKSLITNYQIIPAYCPDYDQDIVQELRKTYAEDQCKKRDKLDPIIAKEVKELRYLINLMEKQINGENDDADECPICKCDCDSFMVFSCGHRICLDCYERLKSINRDQYQIAHEILLCPSCRHANKEQQIMMAQNGYSEKDSVIPGVILSAKLSAAVKLIRGILEEDSSNKVIIFTAFEPSGGTCVWQYLLRILRLAKLPFAATTRSNCGKKIIDFEVSQKIKVLLCSLSLCANGLNMTGANHIIFLDPPHLQSVLHQAIGRINRFGQKRAMTVHHLVLEGSMDSELRRIAKTNRGEDERKGWTVGDIRGMFDIPPPPPS